MASSIGRRYAQAYFDLARESKKVAERRRDLEVADALSNPRLTLVERTRLAQDLLDGIDDSARNLVRLLIERNRTGVLSELLEAYDAMADRDSGVVRAEVVTAVAVDGALEKRISGELGKKLGAAVQTEVRQDPDIIGGLVIRIGDRVIDNSVRTRLEQLRSTLV
jgi:F-type H+-transporting ATPase subunit delta